MKPAQAVIIGTVALVSVGGAYYFTQTTVQPPAKATAEVAAEVIPAVISPAAPPQPKVAAALPGPAPSKASPSPFAVVPTMQVTETQPAPIANPIPAVPNAASLPGYALPPGGAIPGARETVRVIAVIPALKHKGQAILSSGGEQSIVEEGGMSDWGLVTEITDQGLCLNGKFISIDASEEPQLPLLTAPIPNGRLP